MKCFQATGTVIFILMLPRLNTVGLGKSRSSVHVLIVRGMFINIWGEIVLYLESLSCSKMHLNTGSLNVHNLSNTVAASAQYILCDFYHNVKKI
jgi:hypothetical protein